MNLIRLILLSLFIFTQAQADTIYNLIKIPNLKIYEIDKSNKLRYLYAKQPFTIGLDNNINCFNSEKKILDKKYKIIQKNLNRYNQKFLRKINLKYIVLCEDLSISKIKTAGIPDNVMKTLILDVKFNEKYFERVIHHELFHIINDGFKDLFNENEWKKFNLPSFKYADCSTCSKKVGLDTYKDTNGFFFFFSMTIPSEDMAEVYSHLITGNYKISDDKILNKKIKFIKDKLNEIDNTFVF